MGLAYNLDVSLWDNFGDYLSYGIIDLANKDPNELILNEGGDWFSNSLPQGDWMFRFCGNRVDLTDDTQCIFPTGEYIIRDVVFINGIYIFVGSYRAYFRNLYAVGTHGYAWDGFIMPLRGYTQDTTQTAPFIYNATTGAYLGLSPYLAYSGWGFMPMRMPLDIIPGKVVDAIAVGNDNTVGLTSIDIWKPPQGIEVGGLQGPGGNVSIIAAGHQRIGDSVAEGMTYTDIDYFGFVWVSQLLAFQDVLGGSDAKAIRFSEGLWPYVGGDPDTYNQENSGSPMFGDISWLLCSRQQTYQISWNATTNYTCPLGLGMLPSAQTRLRNFQDSLAVSTVNSGGTQFTLEDWSDGYNADGTSNVGGPPLGIDARASTFNIYPRRIMGLVSYSAQFQAAGGGTTAESPFILVGDASLGGDPTIATPVITSTVPMAMGASLPWEWGVIDATTAPPGDKATTWNPFMVAHCAGTSFVGSAAAGASEWVFEGTFTATNNFDGAYGAFAQVPYETTTTFPAGGDNPSNQPPLNYYAVNEVSDSGGGTNAALFVCNESILTPGNIITSIIAPNQNPAPSTYGLPNAPKKWYAKAMQSRTFTVAEEERTKYLNYWETEAAGGAPPYADPITIVNCWTGEQVGVFGNYQRYGLDADPTGLEGFNKQMGSASRQGYGLLGWDATDGPIVFMFDSSRGWLQRPTEPPPNFANPEQWSNVVLNVGARFNAYILKTPNVTNRYAICGQWDNDRDQWLFMFIDATDGQSIVSATSTFTDNALGQAYLDQTQNFAAKAPTPTDNYQTGIWEAFLMTNELDGIVVMGGDDRTNTKTNNIYNYSGSNPSSGSGNKNWVYGVQVSSTTQTPPNTWGSGVQIGTIEALYARTQIFTLKGTTGREAKVWVDYILFDGADAVIATKLRERGMKVSIEAVEWFKRTLIHKGDLNIKQEEIEMWMREQQDEFNQMMQEAERQGRVRKRKKQVSAYGLDMLESLNTDFEDKEVQEFMKEYLPQSRPPTPEEIAIEKQQKGGYAPFSKNYYDEVFEN
ncbi:MAG: hypothetical protein CMA77_01035 [Euryarchaeota archaeon]|nr:hypothetical protein [Euryarchaeota archaeon]